MWCEVKMLPIQIVVYGEERLRQRLRDVAKNFDKEIEAVVYRTAKRVARLGADEIRDEIGTAINKRDVAKKFVRKKISHGRHKVLLHRDKRLQLSLFSANQTRKGVTYRMRGARHTVPAGFMGVYKTKYRSPKLKGGAWKRINESPRAKIVQLFGPSPWGVMNPSMSREPRLKRLKATVQELYYKELEKRINYQISKLN